MFFPYVFKLNIPFSCFLMGTSDSRKTFLSRCYILDRHSLSDFTWKCWNYLLSPVLYHSKLSFGFPKSLVLSYFLFPEKFCLYIRPYNWRFFFCQGNYYICFVWICHFCHILFHIIFVFVLPCYEDLGILSLSFLIIWNPA